MPRERTGLKFNMREPAAIAGEPCKTCGHKSLPVKTYSWLRVHLKYWWSSNPDNHHDWVMSNLLKQYPDGVELEADDVQDETKDDLDDILHRWCKYAFGHRSLENQRLGETRRLLNDIIAVRCLAGIYDGAVSFPVWLKEFELDEKRRIKGCL